MSKEDLKLIEQISRILVREKLISSKEHLRIVELLKKEMREVKT